jgi:hypothetical protein
MRELLAREMKDFQARSLSEKLDGYRRVGKADPPGFAQAAWQVRERRARDARARLRRVSRASLIPLSTFSPSPQETHAAVTIQARFRRYSARLFYLRAKRALALQRAREFLALMGVALMGVALMGLPPRNVWRVAPALR